MSSANSIHRKLSIRNCELTQLPKGIGIQLENPDTTSNVLVEHSYFHNFAANSNGIISLPVSDNSRQTILAKNSTFYKVGVGNGNALFIQPAQNAQLKLKVESCSFEETLVPNQVDGVLVENFNSATSTVCVVDSTFTNIEFAIEPITFDTSSIETVVSRSTGNNVGNFFTPLLFGGQQTNKLCGNTVCNGGIFYNTATGGPTVEQSLIEDNVFNGQTGFLVEAPPAGVAWKLLEINAKHNCFNGGNVTGSIGFDVQSGNKGTLVIRAHENTFAGFLSDITDGGSSASYLVNKNFWGIPTKTCTTASMCGQYQVCENSLCLGPTTTLTIPGFSGYIDASNPLLASLDCPSNCCSGTLLPQTIKRSAEEMRTILEKKKATRALYQLTETAHPS